MKTLKSQTLTQFDLEPLLAPIPGEHPAGQWLRFDVVYDDLRKLREADDPMLPLGVWQRELKRADWSGVVQLASETLATRSKDLQIAMWLTEAWLQLGGYKGFAAGMRLAASLCRAFWPDLHPPLEGESLELRAAPLAWAADKLMLPLENVPVTDPDGEESKPYAWIDRRTALYYDNVEKKHPSEAASAYAGGAASNREFLLSVALTPAEFYVALARDAAEARAAVVELRTTFAENAGVAQTPSFAKLIDMLDGVIAFAERNAPPPAATSQPAPFPDDGAGWRTRPTFEEEPMTDGPIGSRAEAFERLREAADFLLRTEPHSPVPYLVMRAVSWEHLPLPELLAELLQKQKNDLAAVYALLGLQQEM